MTSPVPRIANAALQESVDGVLMQVDRDTVLRARAVLMQEADELEEAMHKVTKRVPSRPQLGRQGEPGCGVWIGRCSDDPISAPAQISFNRKIAEMLKPCHEYIAGLRLGGAQLAEAARSYGYSEDEILASFRSVRSITDDGDRAPS